MLAVPQYVHDWHLDGHQVPIAAKLTASALSPCRRISKHKAYRVEEIVRKVPLYDAAAAARLAVEHREAAVGAPDRLTVAQVQGGGVSCVEGLQRSGTIALSHC